MNRRDFLKTGAAVIAVAVIPWPRPVPAPTVRLITCRTIETITYDRAATVSSYLSLHRHAPGIFFEREFTFPAINVLNGDSIQFTTEWICP